MNIRRLDFRKSEDVQRELARLEVHQHGIRHMTPKGLLAAVRVDGVPLRAALILKQDMLAAGGDAALPEEAAALTLNETPVILMGTLAQFSDLARRLKKQPFGLKDLGALVFDLVFRELAQPEERFFIAGGHRFPLGRQTYIMGILNITPDSFSDGGLYSDRDEAVAHATEMVKLGADFIDIGAESTRPGADPVSAEVEKERLLPVLERLVGKLEVPISVDTYKPEVARAAIELGADIINDVKGLSEPGMTEVIAEGGASVIIMHNQAEPRYQDLVGEVTAHLAGAARDAQTSGIPPEKIALDPGFGFGKTTDQNLALLQRLLEIKSLGFPLLVGTSRKSMIGRTLNLPVEERMEGTAATVAMSIERGADIIRVHDVREMSRVARMTDAVVRRKYDV